MGERVWRGLASDNYAGVHPDVWAAMAAVNRGHAAAYGGDPCTASTVARFREHFGESVLIVADIEGRPSSWRCAASSFLRPEWARRVPTRPGMCGPRWHRSSGRGVETVRFEVEDLAGLCMTLNRICDHRPAMPPLVPVALRRHNLKGRLGPAWVRRFWRRKR